MTTISQTSPQDWRYIAEGGSSIVFSYVGPPDPSLTQRVLRLRKTSIRTTAHRIPASSNDDDPFVIFQQTVMHKLVPPEFLPEPRIVELDVSWLVELAKLAEEKRPAARRAEDTIDLARRTAVLGPNLIGESGLAVEIKPKWGFLPCPAYLSPATCTIKSRTCRFCIHAHAKYRTQKDVSWEFCPLDLYSGDEERVRTALCALWDSWIRTEGRINNLRVFVDGRVIKPASEPSPLYPLAHKLRLSYTSDPDPLRDRFISVLLPTLLSSHVFSLLSLLQRTLDPLDIEGLSALWTRAHARLDPVPPLGIGPLADEPTQEEWSRFVEEFQARQSATAAHALTEPRPEELRYYCMAYLLSATFKDCSLLIRDLCVHSDSTRAAEMKLIDLDVKSTKRLGTWERLDRDIVETYRGVEVPRRCVDASSNVTFDRQGH